MLDLKRWAPIAGVLAATLSYCAAAHADVAVYTDRGSFTAALPAAAVTDGFDDLAAGEVAIGPLLRGAGATAYTVSVRDTLGLGSADYAQDFYPVTAGVNGTALSPNYAANVMVFDHFSSSARAIGGNFFSTGEDGAFLPGQTLILTLVAQDGTQTVTLQPSGLDSFVGFSANGPLLSLTVSGVQAGMYNWAAVDQLSISAVPEPAEALMLGAGLALLTVAVRRKR